MMIPAAAGIVVYARLSCFLDHRVARQRFCAGLGMIDNRPRIVTADDDAERREQGAQLVRRDLRKGDRVAHLPLLERRRFLLDLLLVTSEGRVIGADRNEMQIIRNFIGQADNADHPQKKKYGRVEMVGPFSVRDGEDNYQLYLIRPASSSQSDFINLLFDRPLLLLIVTMLVSSPLLLWLAWSLAKPARKLKNAADEVAQGFVLSCQARATTKQIRISFDER